MTNAALSDSWEKTTKRRTTKKYVEKLKLDTDVNTPIPMVLMMYF